MTEVVTAVVTLSRVSAWSLTRSTPNSPSARFVRRTACTCVTFQQENGVGSALSLALMRLEGAWGGGGGVENRTPVALPESLT